MLCSGSELASSSYCQDWWTPSIGRSLLLSYISRGCERQRNHIRRGRSIGRGHSSGIDMACHRHALCCDDGECLNLPVAISVEWTSCLANTLALVQKSCHITTTEPVITVYITVKHVGGRGCTEGRFYFQRDSDACHHQHGSQTSSWMKIAPSWIV